MIYNKKLVIIRGLPGSGKSTFAKLLSPNGYAHVEADQWFVDDSGEYKFDVTKLHLAHKWCENKVLNFMRIGTELIIVSNTFTTEKELKPYLEMADTFGYDVNTIIVESRYDRKSIHNVPDEAIDKMKQRFSVKL